VVNSFSKYQGMTGWRLGWLVSPPEYVDAIERLAQNIFIAAATPAQYAALATFQQDTILELEQRRRIFQQRRDFLMPALTEIGFEFAGWPQGAFYLYAECSKFADDSHAFVLELLEQAGVAVTPGIDFGDFNARRYVRFSYANSIDSLREGVRRIGEFLDR
jgi:aspartate/methionine/tyrosine aminotransferase